MKIKMNRMSGTSRAGQLDLFEYLDPLGPERAAVWFGHFFEELTQMMFGGWKGYSLIVNLSNNNKKSNRWGRGWRVCWPDILLPIEKIIYESKAIFSGRYDLVCLKRQLEGYGYLTDQENYKVYYVVFDHSIGHLQKRKWYPQRLISEVSKSILHCTIIPFSLIRVMASKESIKKGLSSVTVPTGTYPPYYRYKANLMRQFRSDSNTAITRLGLNSDNYGVDNIQFPKGVVIDNNKIKPFPITRLKEI